MQANASAEVLHDVHDDLGHVVGLTDAGIPDAYPDPVPAELVERYVYDPYGRTYTERWNSGGGGSWERVAASRYGNPFGWTGQRYDAGVGLYAFLFRTYSPELGRWLQRDPAGFVDGVNVYEYVRSGPLSGRDRLGLWDDDKCARIHQEIVNTANSLWRELREYVPAFDVGGKEKSAKKGGGPTEAGGHYPKLVAKQRHLQNLIQKYYDNCPNPGLFTSFMGFRANPFRSVA